MTTTTMPSEVREGLCDPSPIHRVMAFGWYDGPEEGILQFGDHGPDFRFATLFKQKESDDAETWVYGLFPLPEGSLQRVVDGLSKFVHPRWPCWVPIWKFPTDGDTRLMDQLVDGIIAQSGPLTWIVVGPLVNGPIHVMAMPATKAS